MILAGLSLALVITLFAGLGLSLLALRRQKEVNLAEILALSWFFGTGVISLLLWSGGLFLSGALLQAFVTLFALFLGGFGLSISLRQPIRMIIPRPKNYIELILGTTIAIQFAIILYASFATGLGWDGLFNWEIKARYAFFNHGVLPAQYFSDASRDFTHQMYPPWIPLSELWLYLWMGEAHQFWAKTLFAPFYGAGIILLVILGSRLTSRRWIGLLTGALLFFVPCLTTSPGGAQLGYVDVPVSMVYLAAIGYLLLAVERNDSGSWRIYSISLGLLPWAKQEGLILWVVAALCGLWAIWRSKCSWLKLPWLLPGPAIAVVWRIFYRSMGKTEPFEYLPMTWATLVNNLPRATPIGHKIGAEFVDVTRWSIFWPLAAIALVSLFWRNRDRYRLPILLVATLSPLFIYPFTYLFSGWPDWSEHVDQSLSRLFLHVMPVLWLAIALAIRPPQVSSEQPSLLATPET